MALQSGVARGSEPVGVVVNDWRGHVDARYVVAQVGQPGRDAVARGLAGGTGCDIPVVLDNLSCATSLAVRRPSSVSLGAFGRVSANEGSASPLISPATRLPGNTYFPFMIASLILTRYRYSRLKIEYSGL
jgi:hypothetical protein